MRDYSAKIDNTAPSPSGILSAAEDNVRFEEMKQAVISSGITLDPASGPNTDQKMLAQAMSRYASGGIYGVDSGSANTYVLASPSGASGFVMPKALFQGMRVFWVPANSNTGASTVNAWGLGVKNLKDFAGNALADGMIIAGRPVEMHYDLATTSFRLAPWCTLILKPTAKPSYITGALAVPPTCPNNAFTKVTGWSTSSGLIASSWASNRLTIAGDDAGLWFFFAKTIITTEEAVCAVFVNGIATSIANGDGYINETSFGRYSNAAGFVPLLAGDYVEIFQYQRNAAASALAISSAEFGGFKIRA